MRYRIPTRGLLGIRNALLTATKGTAVLNTIFSGYEDWCGDILTRWAGRLRWCSSITLGKRGWLAVCASQENAARQWWICSLLFRYV